MLPLRTIIFSSHSILFASSLLIGVLAILASIFAITSGRWIHVFRSLPEGVDAGAARGKSPSPTFQHAETELEGSGDEEDDTMGSCCLKGRGALDFTGGCPKEDATTAGGRQCWTSAAADEAYAGLWRVCLLYHCPNGSRGSTVVCRQCLPASATAATAFKRRPPCHVTATAMAISAEAHKTLVVYILSMAVLVCGISLGMAASFCGSFCLILGAFFDTTAGLLQFLGMFLFAIVVSDQMEYRAGHSQLVQPAYNYDWGSIQAVIAFAATNLAAILAAYSYRGRHQLDLKKKKKKQKMAQSLLPEASIDLVKVCQEQS